MVGQILAHRSDGRIGGRLIQLIAERGPVEAVHPEELGVIREGALREIVQILLEVGLRRIEILVGIVAQTEVVQHGIVALHTVGQQGEGLEDLGGAGVLAIVEILESGIVLDVHVVALEYAVILGLAGGHAGNHEQDQEEEGGFFHRFKYFSASSAARHPDAAALTAWR